MWTNDQPDASQCPSNAKRVALKKATFWNPTVYRADDAIVAQHPEWPVLSQSRVLVLTARTLNATGQSRVTLSLR